MLIVLSLLSLSFELLASFWCPCTILPHFVIESGPKMFMETEKFQLFTRFEFPSYVSIKSKLQYPPAGQTPGHFEHRFMQTPCSSSRQNCSNAQPTQLFRERQNRRPWSHTSHDHIAPRNSLPITIGKLFHGGMCCLFWSSRMNQYNFRCFVALVSRHR